MSFLDQNIIKDILETRSKYNSYYIYDFNEINSRIHNIVDYMPGNFSLYYAIKANSNSDVLKYIKSFPQIAGFEIASSGELAKSLSFCSSDEILYTGPGKTEKDLENAIKNKIKYINVESVTEAIRINNLAQKLKINKVDVLLRINMDYKIVDADENMGGISTKMGIDEKQYYEAYTYISKLEHINVVGIHVFSASGILNYKASIDYARYVFDMVVQFENMGQNIKVVDLGGGIGVDYTDEGREFDTKQYFYELKKLIDEYGYSDKNFILELGCYLVATCGYYVSRIIDIKESKEYKHVVLSGGLNHIPTASFNGKHPFYIVHMHEKKLYENQISVYDEIVDIDGPLCTADDKVLWDVHVDEANIGDYVVIKVAGAYCYNVAWLEFLSHEYPIELIKNDDKVYESTKD